MARLLVSTRKGIFAIERNGSGWSVNNAWFEAENVPIVAYDARDDAIYAAMDHGHFGAKLWRSDDHGANWTECAVPAYPEPPAGYEEPVNAMSGKVVPWKLKLLWSIVPGGADQPGRLWCGTLPGGLFRSDDRGASWQLNDALWLNEARQQWFGGGYDVPGIHSVEVDPRDSRDVLVGVSCGGVWRTTDDGASWTCDGKGMRAEYMPPERAYEPEIQDPHCLVRCPAAPDSLWVQHHNGVFKSADNGANWTELSNVIPSTFGFAVAVHPTDPDRAWFVPAIKDEQRIPVDGKLVVSRTTDGGASFEVLSEGLPQKHAYDLVFRHALDISADGDLLAFGSTTGNLWVSENQGDSWELVSSYLPPVYCVRWTP